MGFPDFLCFVIAGGWSESELDCPCDWELIGPCDWELIGPCDSEPIGPSISEVEFRRLNFGG